MQHMLTAWFHNWLKYFSTAAAIITEVKIDTILGYFKILTMSIQMYALSTKLLSVYE